MDESEIGSVKISISAYTKMNLPRALADEAWIRKRCNDEALNDVELAMTLLAIVSLVTLASIPVNAQFGDNNIIHHDSTTRIIAAVVVVVLFLIALSLLSMSYRRRQQRRLMNQNIVLTRPPPPPGYWNSQGGPPPGPYPYENPPQQGYNAGAFSPPTGTPQKDGHYNGGYLSVHFLVPRNFVHPHRLLSIASWTASAGSCTRQSVIQRQIYYGSFLSLVITKRYSSPSDSNYVSCTSRSLSRSSLLV
ncbi:hypothetical protein DFH05DRAFT_422415 [Lentinula detonsa]|uniref:Uncharacterized protein n=1 Tax=Lentinula detonsa TaxID=2804962 RepID=A0A9W8NTM0_9AGAR|nr:hypothetical protein DFH05DRAFT_422415 [Lentinula detonsa]